MKQSEVTYDDDLYRLETRTLWSSFTDDVLQDGPYKGVDLVSDNYDVEVAYTTIPFDKRKEFRLEQRKLRYWLYSDKPTHYVAFNKNLTEAKVWPNSIIRQWIDQYPIEYRYCKGWPKANSYFLIIPLHEKDNMKFYSKDDSGWFRNKSKLI